MVLSSGMPGSFCHNVTHCVWNILEARDDVIISKKESDFHLAASKSTERSLVRFKFNITKEEMPTDENELPLETVSVL